MPAREWGDEEHAGRYLARADEFPHRAEADAALLEQVPPQARRILDLGTGDGRVLDMLGESRPDMAGIGFDIAPPMLTAAKARLGGDDRFELAEHDLVDSLPPIEPFDAVVSSFAIHHLEHERKRSLYREIFGLLVPGGVFVNLEHVASPTRALHLAFLEAIDEPLEHDDPSDRLLDVETQLNWLRELGFAEVDCFWKWREMAVLAGVKPEAAN